MIRKDDDREMDGRRARNEFYLSILYGYVYDLATYELLKVCTSHK